jgi:hypothetical protein
MDSIQIVKNIKKLCEQKLKERSSFIFKQGTKQDNMNKKQKLKNLKQKHNMCKKNVKTDLYYANICKHEHEKNMTRFDARSCLKLVLNKLKEMRGPTLIYTPFET